LTAWENGPTGGVSSGEVIAVLLIANPVAISVADQSPKPHESRGVSLDSQHSTSSLFSQ
jgi:hypothetical protein